MLRIARIFLPLAFLFQAAPCVVADGMPVEQTSAANWTGLYVGASGGLAVGGGSDWTVQFNGVNVSPGMNNGGIFGGQAGYLFQWGSVVAGAEISYSGTNNLGGSTSCPYAVFTCSNDIDNILLINGRLGYAFDNALLYATGGFARAHLSYEAAAPISVPGNATGSGTSDGWNLGAGFEYLLSDTVILGVEYIHADLSEGSVPFAQNDGDIDLLDTSATLDIVRLRLGVKVDGLIHQ